MKFSENWLREWVNPKLDSTTLVEQLTQAGLEVDAVSPVAGEFSGVVIGQVVSVEAHPNADKLNICQVNVAGDELLTIVCGAANVRVDLKVPVAIVGAVLPGNFKIKKAKLRGEPSFGMLCSAKELGLAESADGLMELANDAAIGQDIRAYLQLDDLAIDVDLTPNRSDCLSIAGIAREVGVLTGCDVMPAPQIENKVQHTELMAVEVKDVDACPRYVGRVIKQINSAAVTPLWMEEKLRRSGIRSLGAVVDVTNYVMLELGQPMHAFDHSKLDSHIVVRRAEKNESLTLLNEQNIELAEGTLVIADKSAPLALAGIMGGKASSVSDQTQTLFLEAAFFAPLALAGCAREYGLHTDSSHRFERGVDPELPRLALERATALLLEIVGGEAGPITEVCSADKLPKAQRICLREERIKRVLGVAIAAEQVEDQLSRLGLTIAKNQEGWDVTAPSFRFDLAIEVDLIEELGRLYGYDKLPKTRPQGTVLSTDISEKTIQTQRLQTLLVDRGYQEAITYSFVDPKLQQLVDETDQFITLANPISAELSVMRTSLWPGLVQALSYNLKRQHERVRLFEVGRTFNGDSDNIEQHRQIGGAICGDRYPEQWSEKEQPVDFYDIKADVEAVLALGDDDNIEFIAETYPALHPGQSAQILKNGEVIGWVGALHPKLSKAFELKTRVYVFELTLESALSAQIPTFEILSRFPAIRRDLALVIDNSVTVNQLERCLKHIKSDILRGIQLFDCYSGAGIETDKKSVTIAFHLQHIEKTLTDDDVEKLMTTIINTLEQHVGATIRS